MRHALAAIKASIFVGSPIPIISLKPGNPRSFGSIGTRAKLCAANKRHGHSHPRVGVVDGIDTATVAVRYPTWERSQKHNAGRDSVVSIMMPMISSPNGNKSRAIATNADMGTNASLDGRGITPDNVKLNLVPY
jgi:hypothetical protein